ncbi:MAG: hypothetical protein ACQ9ET_00695 [Nitrosomonadaceae bacterium]
MKVRITKKYKNKYGREFKAGVICTMFSDDAKEAIDKGYAIDLGGVYKRKKIKINNNKEDK